MYIKFNAIFSLFNLIINFIKNASQNRFLIIKYLFKTVTNKKDTLKRLK